MAADLFRVVFAGRGADGVAYTAASEPLSRGEAMARFDDGVKLGMARLRVIRESDYQPALFGPQNQPGVYAGEAARRRRAPVHYGNNLTPTACDLAADQVPFLDQVTLTSSLVTCERCHKATGGSR